MKNSTLSLFKSNEEPVSKDGITSWSLNSNPDGRKPFTFILVIVLGGMTKAKTSSLPEWVLPAIGVPSGIKW